MREQQRAQEQARAQPQVTKVGTAAAPARLHSKTEYMYVWPLTALALFFQNEHADEMREEHRRRVLGE